MKHYNKRSATERSNFMKKIKCILFFVLLFGLYPIAGFAQNHRDLCDKNEPIMVDWESKKNIFTPKDLSSFPLLVESLTDDQNDSLKEKSIRQYIETKQQVIENGFFGCYPKRTLKNFRKYFKRDYEIVNTDSIDHFTISEFPYILRLYSEPMETSDGKIALSVGVVIYDRRNQLAYPMIVMLRSKREKWVFNKL